MELIKTAKRASTKRSFMIVISNQNKELKVEVSSEYALYKAIKNTLKQCNEYTDINIRASRVSDNIEVLFGNTGNDTSRVDMKPLHASSSWGEQTLLAGSSDKMFFAKLQKHIMSNIDNSDLSVEYLSKILGVSRVQMYRKCMSIIGISPVNYIKNMRMELATELLGQNKYSISEIAYNSGFSDPRYFTLCFIKRYGVSPSKWLKKTNTR
jgi:AraC-like DNA-binding protein